MKVKVNLSNQTLEYMDSQPYIQGTDTRNKLSVYIEHSSVPQTEGAFNIMIAYALQNGRTTIKMANTGATSETIDDVLYDIFYFTAPKVLTSISGNFVATLILKVNTNTYKVNVLNTVLNAVDFEAFEDALDDTASEVLESLESMAGNITYLQSQVVGVLHNTDIVDNDDSNDPTKVLSARMGKVLAERIGATTSGLVSATYNESTGVLTLTYENDDTYEMKIGLDATDIQAMSDDVLNDVNDDLTLYKESVNQSLENMTETIEGLGNLEPSGVDTSTNILAFTTNKGIYIGTDTGKWYYWDANATPTGYVAGGIYQTAVNYDELEDRIENLEDNINDFTDNINLCKGVLYYGGWNNTNWLLTDDNTHQKICAVIPCKPNTHYWLAREQNTDRFGRIGTINTEPSNGVSITNVAYDLGNQATYNFVTDENAKYILVFYTYTGLNSLVQITDYQTTTLNQNTYPVLKDAIYDKNEVNELISDIGVNNKTCKFSKDGNSIYIYIPSEKSNKYIRFKYMLVNDTTINLNQWKVMDTSVVDNNLNVLFDLFGTSNSVEWEGVVQEQGASDFIGGYHGDETNEYLSVFVDGQPIDMTQDYNLQNCNEIKIVNKSIVNRCNTPNDNLFTRYKVNIWNKNKYTIRNRWIALQDNITLNRIYMTMLSLPVVKGNYNVANYGRYDDKYIIQDYSGAAISGSCLYNSNYAKEVEFWGTDFYGRVKAIYDDYTGYLCYCDRSQTNVFKAYFRQGNRTLNINDEINGLSEFEFKF